MSHKLSLRTIRLLNRTLPCLTLLSVMTLLAAVARSEEPDPAKIAQPSPAAEKGSASDLAREQQQLAEKYKRFEEVLLRMAELTAPTDPNGPRYCAKPWPKASTN